MSVPRLVSLLPFCTFVFVLLNRFFTVFFCDILLPFCWKTASFWKKFKVIEHSLSTKKTLTFSKPCQPLWYIWDAWKLLSPFICLTFSAVYIRSSRHYWVLLQHAYKYTTRRLNWDPVRLEETKYLLFTFKMSNRFSVFSK